MNKKFIAAAMAGTMAVLHHHPGQADELHAVLHSLYVSAVL